MTTLLPYVPIDVDGRELGRRLRGFNAGQRALVALDLERGAVRLLNLTTKQSAAIAQVSSSTIIRALCPPHWQPPTDAEIEHAIHRFGADRVRQVLDQITAPMSVAAE